MTLKTLALWLLTPTGLWFIWLTAFAAQSYDDNAWWAIPFILTQVVVVCVGVGISLWATREILKRQLNNKQ